MLQVFSQFVCLFFPLLTQVHHPILWSVLLEKKEIEEKDSLTTTERKKSAKNNAIYDLFYFFHHSFKWLKIETRNSSSCCFKGRYGKDQRPRFFKKNEFVKNSCLIIQLCFLFWLLVVFFVLCRSSTTQYNNQTEKFNTIKFVYEDDDFQSINKISAEFIWCQEN